MTRFRISPWSEGYEDYWYGWYDNPYRYGTWAWSEYLWGWCDAEEDGWYYY